MSDPFSFSVHENDYSQVFELNSTEEVIFPEYKSIETFIGRKCFEFEWQSGDKGFGVGVYSVYSKSKRGRLTCSQILRGKRKMKKNNCDIYLN